MRIYYHDCEFNYQLLAVMLLQQPNGQLLVAVDHSQLQIMAPEMTEPIDGRLPTSTWQCPLTHFHSANDRHKSECLGSKSNHRDDCCLSVFIKTPKNLLNNLSLNFTEVMGIQTKLFLRILLLSVNFEKLTFINQKSDRSVCCLEAVIGRSSGLQR